MARIARVVAPGIPHHITQQGNWRQETFVCAEDYQAYIGLMREWRGTRRAHHGAAAGVGGQLDGLSRHGRPGGRGHGTPPP